MTWADWCVFVQQQLLYPLWSPTWEPVGVNSGILPDAYADILFHLFGSSVLPFLPSCILSDVCSNIPAGCGVRVRRCLVPAPVTPVAAGSCRR